MLTFNYNLYNSDIQRTDFIEDFGVFLDNKLYFHQHANYLFSHNIQMLGVIMTITFPFSFLDSVMML
jgi:hypothetical protein